MDIRQLRTFVQVAEMRSITRAAAALHTAQPALSRQLRLLEEELGETLFERGERGVTLTAAGEQLLHRATSLVRDFDSLKTDLARRSRALSGHVRFGVPKSLMESYVAPAVAEFHETYPAISMALIEGTTLELREQVRMGALDLAIVSDLDRSPSARMQSLFREPLVLAAHAASKLRMSRPVSLRTVAEQVLVTASRPNVIRLTLEDALHREGLAPRWGFETNSHVAARILASSGKVHAALTYSAIAVELKAGHIAAAPIQGAAITWNIIVTPLRELPRQAAVLRGFMIDAAAAWVKKQRWPSGLLED
ncbi:LysR family transcriptional regulator [Ottowia sp.]|jgi:LysR family nitrogen assimilation transcriptional regulator|uniref:LysR family transcriptional regulator n=1 Tax=Ottowia sp. TaxID=1898956 RepID=UPI0025F34D02|nr:LysR family transcriptional regulator [Ottowia sp.]MBK6612556.1 LysR family transcriptional regulator [Ottowia sp.]